MTNRLLVLVLALLLVGLSLWLLRDTLSLKYLAEREGLLRDFQASYPMATVAIALGIYVAITGLSLPSSVALALISGWYFGFWQGLGVASIGSTAGATMAFLLCRYLFREWVQARTDKRLLRIKDAFEHEGAFFLFLLRLAPMVPFFVVNAVMGLTKIRIATFWWVSQIGMLPSTVAYTYAGATLPSLQVLADEGIGQVLSWQIFLAFTIVSVLPLVIRKMIFAVRYRGLYKNRSMRNR